MSIVSYEEMSRAVDRNAHLASPADFMVLRFILGRTYGCGKEWAKIRPTHFIDGIYEDDGAIITPPLTMSARTLHTRIAVLESHGMLLVDRSSKTFSYCLNPRWFLSCENKDSQTIGPPL